MESLERFHGILKKAPGKNAPQRTAAPILNILV